jgi:hypothetical protein
MFERQYGLPSILFVKLGYWNNDQVSGVILMKADSLKHSELHSFVPFLDCLQSVVL